MDSFHDIVQMYEGISPLKDWFHYKFIESGLVPPVDQRGKYSFRFYEELETNSHTYHINPGTCDFHCWLNLVPDPEWEKECESLGKGFEYDYDTEDTRDVHVARWIKANPGKHDDAKHFVEPYWDTSIFTSIVYQTPGL